MVQRKREKYPNLLLKCKEGVDIVARGCAGVCSILKISPVYSLPSEKQTIDRSLAQNSDIITKQILHVNI